MLSAVGGSVEDIGRHAGLLAMALGLAAAALKLADLSSICPSQVTHLVSNRAGLHGIGNADGWPNEPARRMEGDR